MNILKLNLFEGAQNARGLTVIIDVFRAFSVACYLIDNGASRIYPVASIDEAYEMKRKDSQIVLIGERHEKICPGFDFGNSPSHVQKIDFKGKTIVHTTSSGTQGIELASNADEIITGSFVNAKAIVRYIQSKNPTTLSLVGMGYEGRYDTYEDVSCANYIESELRSLSTDLNEITQILKYGDGARFFELSNQEHSPSSDFDLCLNFNHFNFILKVMQDQQGRKYLEKINI